MRNVGLTFPHCPAARPGPWLVSCSNLALSTSTYKFQDFCKSCLHWALPSSQVGGHLYFLSQPSWSMSLKSPQGNTDPVLGARRPGLHHSCGQLPSPPAGIWSLILVWRNHSGPQYCTDVGLLLHHPLASTQQHKRAQRLLLCFLYKKGDPLTLIPLSLPPSFCLPSSRRWRWLRCPGLQDPAPPLVLHCH